MVRPGELVADEQGRLSPGFTRKWNAFVRAVESLGKPFGRGVRRRELPDQIIVSYDVKTTVRQTTAFAISTESGGSENIFLVRVGFGLVAGLEPKIEGRAISEELEGGETPSLKVSDFDKNGRCRLYFKLVMNKDWSHKEVTVIASSVLPKPEPYTGFKLLGLLLNNDGSLRVVQAAKRNIGHETSERRENGTATHYWWAEDS